MTRHGPALLALSVLAIAGWTYNVNYDTRAALDRVTELRARIAEEREALQVLRVEWAWLNQPERLVRLVSEHDERLALAPLTPDALGHVAAVPYPPDLPADPVPPAEVPEALIAAAPAGPIGAPAAETMADATPPQVSDALVAADVPDDGMTLADAAREDATDEPQLAEAAAAEKAEVLTERADRPTTMQEAVALALVEAGVVGAKAAGLPVIAASAPSGIPMPPVRPAVWSGQ